MNEVSNGPSGNMEYVEFVVVDSNVTYNCSGVTNPPCIDLRGWIFDDNSGYHGASGIASGCIRFSNDPFWSCIPVGTIILIYNNLDPNSSLPPNDVSMSDGNCRLVLPVNNATLFESNATTPGAAACSYPAAGWTASGNWNNTLFANTGDCARIVNLAGCEVFSVCWGTDNLNTLIYFTGSAQDKVYFFNNSFNNDPTNISNWTNGCADPSACGSNQQTPGSPNNAANAAWINSFNNGCLPIPPIAAVGSFTNGGCAPCTASASVSASGSIPPYTYTWSPAPGTGQGTNKAGGLCSGTYSCFVQSSIGCLDTIVVNVTSGGAFTGTIASTNVQCNGQATGSATVSLSGGSGPYTYTWSPAPGGGQGTATVSGLSAQVYSLNVKDNSGCTITLTTNITQPPVLTSAVVSSNALCFGGATGSTTVTASGGTPGYTYTWSPTGANAATAGSLTVGSYTVLVKDANNCTVTAVANINQPPALTTTISSTNATCGMPNGSATISVSGGTSAYTYSWSPTGGAGSIASNLAGGTYSVVVTDANNCAITATLNVGQPSVLVPTITAASVTCFGGSNGASAISISGGTGPYTYTWSPAPGAGQGTNLVSGLISQNYTVTATDALGCFTTAVAVINQPPALTASVSFTNATCNGFSNGAGAVIVAGGTGSYTYNWLPAGGNSSVSSSIPAGNYSVSVVDANNCSATATLTISEPPVITSTISSANVTCNGAANGNVSINAGGGTPAYSYTWLPSGGNAGSANNLSPANYTVIIKDANNCVSANTISITEPALINLVPSQTNIICFNGNNGTASVSVSGGMAPYSYSWSVPGNSNPQITGLAAGTYSCLVTDNNNCSVVSAFNISQPAQLVASVSNYTTCTGTQVTVTASVNGGTGPYTFNWNGGTFSGQTINVSPTVTTGYSLEVTDANGCTSNQAISNIIVFDQPAVSVSPATSVCAGNSVQLSVNVTGGSVTMNYLWTPGSFTTPVISVAPSSSMVYSVYVSTSGLCPLIAVKQITVSVVPNPVAAVVNPSAIGCAPLCVEFKDNSSTPSGSIVGWAWNFTNGESSISKDPKICFTKTGTYTGEHTVVNSYGCTSTFTFGTVIVFPKPVADFNHSPVKPIAILDQDVVFTDASWGAPIVSWNWYFMNTAQHTSTQQNPTFSYTEAGTYVVTLVVKSDKGCTDTLSRPLVVGEDYGLYIPDAFTPNADGLNDGFQPKGFGIVKYELYIFDRWGEKLFHTNTFEESWDGTFQGKGNTICEQGVYTWLINVTDVYGKSRELKGHVALIK